MDMSFKDKKVLIMGLGTIGKGLKDALFFYNLGAKITVADLKTENEEDNYFVLNDSIFVR